MYITLISFVTLWTAVNAQKFRMDYMWAHAFKTFYRLHDLATNWQQARQICEAEGTSLLVPGSLEEMENLKLLISNMKAHYTAIFIGIHDQFSEGDFVTIKGEPITGTILELLWADGRPDNGNDTEDCVVMTREGLFDDRPCYDIYPFVCKILGNESRFNDKCEGYDMGYVLHENGKCYKFHSEPLSWYDAYHVCMLEEGSLCVLNSAEEASLVVSMLGEHLNNNAPDSHMLHIGFTDLMFPFQYRTITGETLEEAGYSSWSPLQEGMRNLKNYRCGALSRTGFLKTTSCLHPAMFLCEKLKKSTLD
ncbi:PREDICTED: C-type mannose receptor 2-like [Papilio xuthus]|uniref:C-type mannose receptor 2-like n=1 Tax=Papilio xuthus TaxID=66420 RepID=A0AAJ7EG40_PAPXU|nr:PREDICTED: C-type mannose receptor 2-like [Papilio xuthus]